MRSSVFLAVLVSLAGCALPADTATITAVTTTDSLNFPDGENCGAALDVRAAALFETWFASNDLVRTAMMVDHSAHSTVAWNNGGSHRMVLRAVLQGEAGGLILQTQTYGSGYNIYSNDLVFFDAAGR